jgi:hypothetical protein
MQVHICKFTKLKNLKNYNLIITILQLYKLQVCICKFTSLQVYKIKKSRNYNLTNCKCAFASSQVFNFTKLQNLEITTLQIYNMTIT